MEFFKKHADSVAVIATIVGAVLWMSSQFTLLHKDLAELDKDIAIIKTVLIMKNVMPAELAIGVQE